MCRSRTVTTALERGRREHKRKGGRNRGGDAGGRCASDYIGRHRNYKQASDKAVTLEECPPPKKFSDPSSNLCSFFQEQTEAQGRIWQMLMWLQKQHRSNKSSWSDGRTWCVSSPAELFDSQLHVWIPKLCSAFMLTFQSSSTAAYSISMMAFMRGLQTFHEPTPKWFELDMKNWNACVFFSFFVPVPHGTSSSLR